MQYNPPELMIVVVVIFSMIALIRYLTSIGDPLRRVEVDWAVIGTDEIQKALNRGQKIEAIKVYRQLTRIGLKDAKSAIEYVIANPSEWERKRRSVEASASDAGLRDLIAEGNITEAIEVYKQFAGVDKFTARSAIKAIQREMGLNDTGTLSSPVESGDHNKKLTEV